MKSKIMGRYLPNLNPNVFFEVWVAELHGGYRLYRCVTSFAEARRLQAVIATWTPPKDGNIIKGTVHA